jgi:hypothetical protein
MIYLNDSLKEGLNKEGFLTQMNKTPIINFDGFKFQSERRTWLPRNHQWQTRRTTKSRIGVAKNLQNVFTHLFGF